MTANPVKGLMPKISNLNMQPKDPSSHYLQQLFRDVKKLQRLKGNIEIYQEDYSFFIDVYTAGFLDGQQSVTEDAKCSPNNNETNTTDLQD